jgi:hypothetical protein
MGPSVFLTKKPFQIDFWEGFFDGKGYDKTKRKLIRF